MKGGTAKILFGLTFILTLSAAAQGATFTAATTGDWTAPATWNVSGTDADGIPDADDTVSIPSPRVVTISGGAQSVHILTINSGGTLTVNNGATLTMDGTTGSAISGAGAITGAGTVRLQGTTSVTANSNYTAPFEMAGGTTTGSGTFGGAITILNSATLSGVNQTFSFNGDLTVSTGGTLINTSGTFNAGANVINNGTIAAAGNFNFTGGASNLSGAGLFTGNYTFTGSSPETLLNGVVFGDGNTTSTSLTINAGGSIVTGGNPLTLNGTSLGGTGALSGTGIVHLRGTSSIISSVNITAPFEIDSGTTNGSGTLGGALTVDAGATLSTTNQPLTVAGDLTNNGTITKSSGNFNASGTSIVNNGSVNFSGGAFNFNGGGTQNLSGSGTLTAAVTILSPSVTTLASDFTIGNGVTASALTVNSGGTFAVGGNTLTLNGVTVSGVGSFTSSAAGKIRTQGTSSIAVGSGFTGSLEINSGTTSASGSVSGSVTISSGAALGTTNQSFTVTGDLTNNGTITKTSGNFNAGGANIVNNGSITFSGGAFIFNGGGTQNLSGTGSIAASAVISSPSNVLLGSDHQISALAVNSGGTLNTAAFTLFLSGAGTPLTSAGAVSNVNITYNGTAAQTVQTAANVTYNRLGIDNAAGVTLSSPKTVSQQLTLTNGMLTAGSNLMLADNAIIQRDNGALSGAPTFMGGINLEYVGATNPLTTGNELPVINTILKNLTVNKTVGTSINLNAAATVNGALTLINGFLVPGANILTIAGTGTATGTENGYILGNLTKQYAQIQTFTYPVGTANGYSPLNADVSSVAVTPSSLTVGVVQTVQPNVPAGEQAAALKRYWTVNESGNLAATLAFNYRQVDVPAGFAESDLKLRRYTGGTGVNVPASVDPTGNMITTNGPVADFSDWTAVALGPTAAEASLGGQVVTVGNRGLAGATVMLTDSSGRTLTVKTNSFGYFQFSDLKAGEAYVLSARQKQYSFMPQVVNLTSDLAEVIIAAQ